MAGPRSSLSQIDGRPSSQEESGAVPSVAVVIAAWNAQDTIERAVRSALMQEAVTLQVIVVDDLSTDETRAVVRSIDDRRVSLVESKHNQGPAEARNVGFAQARGDFIAVLDADDHMLPGRLARLVRTASGAKADIIADNMLLHRDDTGQREIFFRENELADGEVTLSRYLSENLMFDQRKALGYLKPIFRAAFLRAHALSYDPQLRVGEDFMLVAEALALGARYIVSHSPGYVYTVSKSGSISNRLSLPKLRAMITANQDFHRRHAASLTPDEQAAFDKRTRSFHDAFDFLQTIEHAKARKPLSALSTIIKNPRSARHFRMTIQSKLTRLVAKVAG